MATSYNGMALTEDFQEEYNDFIVSYADSSCYCSACSMPPCSHCEGGGTHAGHPMSLIETKEAWEPMVKNAVRQMEETGVVEFEEIDTSYL